MFNDQNGQSQTNTDIDQVAEDIGGSDNNSMGLGSNPMAFQPVMPPAPSADSSSATSAPVVVDNNSGAVPVSVAQPQVPAGLENIRNDALQQLSPLVNKLQQSPEEKFKTLMMLIQASDNHDLVKDAYEAANSISDEAMKAEALLAIVNEINYFTRQPTA